MPSLTALEREFTDDVRPLLKRFCHECHAGKVAEADVDLGSDATVADARKRLKSWIKVRAMLETGQMPPKDAPQPTDDERARLRTWVRGFLMREAQARAGDPGPVVLRRLNNAEYAWTVRDLTGVTALDPTSEFPVDGGAGEGFTNSGSGQAMSPALIQKYLDAAKSIAAHAVLTPDGLRFSTAVTRRDQTDELVAQVKAFYGRFTEGGDKLPLRRYLSATLEERAALEGGKKTIAQVAGDRSLSPKYLGALWNALTAPTGAVASPWMEPIRAAWRQTKNNDAEPIVALIESAQKPLWKTNTVGHIGRVGGPKAWLEPVSPFVAQREFRVPLPDAPRDKNVAFVLDAADLGDGREHDVVVWQRPRIEFKADKGPPRPPILLRDLRWFSTGYERLVAAESARTADYLDAVRRLGSGDSTPNDKKPDGAPKQARPDDGAFRAKLTELAKTKRLDVRLLERWVTLGGLRTATSRQIVGHFKTTVTKVHGHDAINGWAADQLPALLTNRSPETISFITITMPGRAVTVHPSPTQDAFVAWRSPLRGVMRISGRVADADDKCGNGAGWRVELTTSTGVRTIASGEFDNGKSQEIRLEQPVEVTPDDVLSLLVTARNKDHSCDTTHIVWKIEEGDGKKRTWDLSREIVDRVQQGNPLADTFGNDAVWHFGATGAAAPPDPVPMGSSLARWRAAARGKESTEALERLANEVRSVLVTTAPDKLTAPDRALRDVLLAAGGPLGWAALRPASDDAPDGKPRDVNPGDATYGLDPKLFGRAPDGSPLDADSLAMHAPQTIEFELPGGQFTGGEFVATAALHPTLGRGGSVRLTASPSKPTSSSNAALGAPILASPEPDGALETAVRQFRDLFPPALCYAPIVPLDEVVTLTLYHREDDHLRRLMLDENQAAELDRLWNELLFVAQEPLALAVAFEQISEFATQDRPDLVTAFEPLRKPILDRAEAFKKRLVSTEPSHIDAVLRFADQAWRRPLTPAEKDALRGLAAKLRASGLGHDDVVRLLLARVLTSPAFLYKIEQPAPGSKPAPVTDVELATRLGYFLASSAPDAVLRCAADTGRLRDDRELVAQTKRLLADAKARRLAIEFACQWMHVRDFDRNNDKNEALFPEFAALRGPMYEETVRFVEDLIRNDGSILSLLDSDHTFVNDALAKHYGIDGVGGSEWRRVSGQRERGRGGVLGMATVLASQSGASRTSPILRGNWVYETLLGERLPRPPANVPRLPDAPPEGLTERQLIEKHSSVEACAKCHVKIDPYGFALERFDPIGRRRTQDVDTRTTLADGTQIDGLAGLKTYLLTKRRDDFVRQFCRKLLGFALGRETQLSDEPLLDEMRRRLDASGHRFHAAVEAIVLSRQFREIRGAEFEDD